MFCCLSYFLCPDGVEAIGELFRVQDANLRARVALQALERWPLSACLELLEFCLNDPSTETSLRTDLELKKKELDIYHWVIVRSSHTCLVGIILNYVNIIWLSMLTSVFRFFSKMLNLHPPLPWATWQELRTESKTNSESMISMMLEAKVRTTHLQQFTEQTVTHCKSAVK